MNDATGGKPPEGPKKPRAKKGPNGISHWNGTRETEKKDTRALIADAIDGMDVFPTIEAIVEAGGGAFSLSSVRRNLPMVDRAQAKFNADLEGRGLPRVRARADTGRTPRQDRLLEEERARSADIARQLAEANATIARLKKTVTRLEAEVASRRKGEDDRRARRTPWNKTADGKQRPPKQRLEIGEGERPPA